MPVSMNKNALLSLGAAMMLAILPISEALAQKYNANGTPNISRQAPPVAPKRASGGGGGGKYPGDNYPGSGGGGGGSRGPNWGAAIPGIIMAIPQFVPRDEPLDGPSPGGRFIDDGTVEDDYPRRPNRPPQQATRRGPSGAPQANERRLVPDEVVIELRNTVTPQQIQALQNRHRLTRLESQTSRLSGTTMYRWRIPDRRSVPAVVRQLETENLVASAQPNYQFTLQQAVASHGDPAQYELAKVRLPEAQALSRGGVAVAIIDSGVDETHAELTGSVVEIFNPLPTPMAAHNHGTAIAALIAGHGKLMGAAPGAKIYAARAFDPVSAGTAAEGTTFAILKSLDWADEKGARIINMSFAGPNDPAIHRALEAAYKKGIVLIAAAGNAGAKSPPLYPAADVNVIAVSATDVDDKLLEASNRGKHIALAAPGSQLLVATPNGYEVSSGTSYSAATVSGVVALMLERRGDLTPGRVREILQATAKDIGPKGRDAMFGAGLADAYAAVSVQDTPPALAGSKARPQIERVSTGVR